MDLSDGRFLSTLPARGATRPLPICPTCKRFLSTLPARGATKGTEKEWVKEQISIHAPREGSDRPQAPGDGEIACNFYPRSPRGERPDATACKVTEILFLSTLPARGATCRQ